MLWIIHSPPGSTGGHDEMVTSGTPQQQSTLMTMVGARSNTTWHFAMASLMLAKSWGYLSKTERTGSVKKQMCSKLIFYLHKCPTMLQSTEWPSLINLWKWEEEWQQIKNFKWVLDVFSCRKWPKKIFKMCQSNLPSDLKNVCSLLTINQNAF